MIRIKSRGGFTKTEKFLNKIRGKKYLNVLDEYAQEGVDALMRATPKDSGLTAMSWSYEIENTSDKTTIAWTNTNENDGVNIAIILQYGHGTGTGGFAQGVDYINPAIKPVMDNIAQKVWEEVTSA